MSVKVVTIIGIKLVKVYCACIIMSLFLLFDWRTCGGEEVEAWRGGCEGVKSEGVEEACRMGAEGAGGRSASGVPSAIIWGEERCGEYRAANIYKGHGV